jgi:hypothetical protein
MASLKALLGRSARLRAWRLAATEGLDAARNSLADGQAPSPEPLPDRDPILEWVPPGHFYSPIPGRDDREKIAAKQDHFPVSIPAVNLNTEAQIELLERIACWYPKLPFSDNLDGKNRYCYLNPTYSYADAIFYSCMLLDLRPGRVIEVGSGWSSALLLDVNDTFFGGSVDITFVEPYPEALLQVTRPGDLGSRLQNHPLQSTPLEMFDALEAGDILFIDSTHVVRAGSDVNFLFFEVLPRLQPGVHIHLHDVFYPFEYPAEWLLEGRSWNEDYFLRAFLQYNTAFEIALFGTYIQHLLPEFFAERMPKCALNQGGSIWLRRVVDVSTSDTPSKSPLG